MNPTQLREFEEMKQKLDTLISFETVSDVKLQNITQTTAVPNGGGNVIHLDTPDRGLVIKYKKKPYIILAYALNDGINARITR